MAALFRSSEKDTLVNYIETKWKLGALQYTRFYVKVISTNFLILTFLSLLLCTSWLNDNFILGKNPHVRFTKSLKWLILNFFTSMTPPIPPKFHPKGQKMLLIVVKNRKITNFRDFLFSKHWAPLKRILMEIVLYTFILMDLIKKSIRLCGLC